MKGGQTQPARVVLASQSPRRRELLTRAGVEFRVAERLVDDTHLARGETTPEGWATALAYLKAAGAARMEAGAPRDGPREIMVGADTVVVKGDRLIGKAESADEAREIIGALSGGEHTVVTGVALVEMGPAGRAEGSRRRWLFVDGARVRVGMLSASAVDEYVASGGWRGKAGAYNLEERVRAGWPITWTGDPTTIMGLPMGRLMPVLRKWGVAARGEEAGR